MWGEVSRLRKQHDGMDWALDVEPPNFRSEVQRANHSTTLPPQNHLVRYNAQYYKKVLLSSFHLNGHTLGFHPQTQNL